MFAPVCHKPDGNKETIQRDTSPSRQGGKVGHVLLGKRNYSGSKSILVWQDCETLVAESIADMQGQAAGPPISAPHPRQWSPINVNEPYPSSENMGAPSNSRSRRLTINGHLPSHPRSPQARQPSMTPQESTWQSNDPVRSHTEFNSCTAGRDVGGVISNTYINVSINVWSKISVALSLALSSLCLFLVSICV